MSQQTDQAVLNFEQQLTSKIAGINLSPCFPKIKQVILTSLDKNFKEGGRFGTENQFGGGHEKWKPSKRASKDPGYKGKTTGGKTLVDTGQLVASVEAGIHLEQRGLELFITLGSNKEYAPIHQFGGDIQTTAGERESKWKVSGSKKKGYKYRFAKATSKTSNTISRKYQVGSHTIHIEKRPYLVLQDEDLIEITLIIQEFVIKELNK